MDNLRQASDARDFEEEVVMTISSSLGDGESVEWGKFVGNSHKFCADAFLEHGCKRLGFTEKTFVEIKYRLTYDIGIRVISILREELDRCQGQLVIICKEKLTDSLWNTRNIGLQGRVTILTYDELKDQIPRNEQVCLEDKNTVAVADPLDSARKDAEDNRITLFLGAGVSMDAKLPSWNKLLEALLVQNKDKPFKHINEANATAISKALADSSIVTGRYIIEGYRKRLKDGNPKWSLEKLNAETQELVNERLREALYSNVDTPTRSELVKAIASVATKYNVENIITYNFDDLIETELQNSADFESIYDESTNRTFGKKLIYHVHGYIPRDEGKPGVPVLSETEYHRLYSHMHHWANVVQLHALYTTTCFFIGFSMTDPNQRRLLDLARNRNLDTDGAYEAKHYVFLRRQKLIGEAVKAVNEEHCKQIETMMLELGLNVIWFDDFKDLPKCLLYVFGGEREKKRE